jgi:hypothetical protein
MEVIVRPEQAEPHPWKKREEEEEEEEDEDDDLNK